MTKYLRIFSYARQPFLIYDFATAPIWISLYLKKILFYFLSVYSPDYDEKDSSCPEVLCAEDISESGLLSGWRLLLTVWFMQFSCLGLAFNSCCATLHSTDRVKEWGTSKLKYHFLPLLSWWGRQKYLFQTVAALAAFCEKNFLNTASNS